MSRTPLSVGELNAMPHITPTGYAEEGREAAARLKQNRPRPIGPCGLPIPTARTTYRRPDSKLLWELANLAIRQFYRSGRGASMISGPCSPRDQRMILAAYASPIYNWPGTVRRTTGRFPKWLEIERQFPAFGEFMAEQRAAAVLPKSPEQTQ